MPTLTKSTIEGSEILTHLFAENWFEENGRREIYVRYYSMPFTPKADFYIPGLDGDVVVYSGVPFRVVVAHISEQKYVSHIPWLIHSEAGKNQFLVERIDRVLPDTDYVLISTPIRGTGDNAYEHASFVMDGFVGMLRLAGGNNLLRELVREAAVEVSSGNMKTATKIVPVPTEIEGPFATAERWQQQKELIDAIADAEESERRRITLATQLVERAFSSQGALKFFSYWVALEVAADTHSSGKIISLLAEAYEQSRAYVQNDLGFQHLWETRTAVFHRGEYYEAPSDVERYIQCLFLDVVRAKLGLDCKGYMAGVVQAGFDVTRLDRTVAQAKILMVDGP